MSSSVSALGRAQSLGEEAANAITHGLGALASLIVLPFLVLTPLRSGRPAAWSFLVFGLSLLVLFASSSLYHASTNPAMKRTLRSLDHSTIYILIAGTYSAYSIGVLGGSKGWVLFGLEWAIAAVGIALNAYGGSQAAVDRMNRYRAAGVLVYLAMGWLIAPVLAEVRSALSPSSFALLLAGGLAYTVGIVFYAIKKVPYFHAVWHLFVIAGASFHVASLLIAASH